MKWDLVSTVMMARSQQANQHGIILMADSSFPSFPARPPPPHPLPPSPHAVPTPCYPIPVGPAASPTAVAMHHQKEGRNPVQQEGKLAKEMGNTRRNNPFRSSKLAWLRFGSAWLHYAGQAGRRAFSFKFVIRFAWK